MMRPRFFASIRRIPAAATALCLLLWCAACRADDRFPPELVNWTAYEDNPVFAARGEGHWDVRIRERGWILREGEEWKMWFTGYDGTGGGLKKLGYATSKDGLKWTRHPENPIYDKHWVEDMMVVKQGGSPAIPKSRAADSDAGASTPASPAAGVRPTYYMFAEGRGDRAHLLKSNDGIRWQRVGRLDVRRKNGEPIEPGPYGTPTAWYEEDTWYLFYERRDAGVWLATSRDMRIWRNVQDGPVLKPGQGPHDEDLIALNQIIKHKGRYYACYHGSQEREGPNLWTSNLAVSEDLVHWTKYPGNPLLPMEENKSSNLLVHDGKQWRMYTMHDAVRVHFAVKR